MQALTIAAQRPAAFQKRTAGARVSRRQAIVRAATAVAYEAKPVAGTKADELAVNGEGIGWRRGLRTCRIIAGLV